jgi:hypothetical protein
MVSYLLLELTTRLSYKVERKERFGGNQRDNRRKRAERQDKQEELSINQLGAPVKIHPFLSLLT